MRTLPTQKIEYANRADSIRRDYARTALFQWVRELIQNGIDAGSTIILFTTFWSATTAGVHRRMVANNGRPMSPAEMRRYLGSHGRSSSVTGIGEEHQGIGSFTSLAEWNGHGIVYISKFKDGSMYYMRIVKDEDGHFAMVQYETLFNPDQGLDGYVEGSTHLSPVVALHLEAPGDDPWVDPDDDDGVNWKAAFPAEFEQGVAVILLGDNKHAFTVFGDPNREEATKYGLQRAIQSRFHTFPKGVTVLVDEYFDFTKNALDASGAFAGDEPQVPVFFDVNGDPAVVTSDMTPKEIRKVFVKQRRNPTGFNGLLNERYINNKPIDGAVVRHAEAAWTHSIPASRKSPKVTLSFTLIDGRVPSRGDLITPPFLAVRHQPHALADELIDVVAEKNPAAFARLAPLVGHRDIQSRMVVIAHVESTKAYRVHWDATRTAVTWSEGNAYHDQQTMPWRYWMEEARKSVPAEFQDALLKAMEASSDTSTAALDENFYAECREIYGISEGWATSHTRRGRTGADIIKRHQALAAKKSSPEGLPAPIGIKGKPAKGGTTVARSADYSVEFENSPDDDRAVYCEPARSTIRVNRAHPLVTAEIDGTLGVLQNRGLWAPEDPVLTVDVTREIIARALIEGVYLNAMRHDHRVTKVLRKGAVVSQMIFTEDMDEDPFNRLLSDPHRSYRVSELMDRERKIRNGIKPRRTRKAAAGVRVAKAAAEPASPAPVTLAEVKTKTPAPAKKAATRKPTQPSSSRVAATITTGGRQISRRKPTASKTTPRKKAAAVA